MVTHEESINQLKEEVENLKEAIENLKEKEENSEKFVSALLKDVFSNLGDDYKAEDLSGFIVRAIDDHIRVNYVSKDELNNYISREDLGDILKELCAVLKDEVGVNTILLEKETKIFLNKKTS
jgi:prefoldin subunit 5